MGGLDKVILQENSLNIAFLWVIIVFVRKNNIRRYK